MEKYLRMRPGLTVLLVLWVAIFTGSVWAQVDFGGKIETSLLGSIDSEGELTTDWSEHLNLEFLLPDYGDTSAKFEFDLYYQPQGLAGQPLIREDVSKLYVKQKFEKFQLTLGRQPISWSFGSLINPVDFSSGMNLLDLSQSQKSENAFLAYIPITWNSNLTLVGAYPEGVTGAKLGGRIRANLYGFDLTANYMHNPKQEVNFEGMTLTYPATHRLALTGKGDLGPIGVYGAMGYQMAEDAKKGEPVFLIGADYSYYLGFNKLLAQVEYLRDEIGTIQTPLYGEEIILGMLGYEIDEFSGVNLMTVVNPKDKSIFLAPGYNNLIGSSLDVTVQGGIFFGEEGSQFAPREIMPGVELPAGMMQVTFSYPF